MQLHLLSRFKIQALEEKGPCDLVVDDLIETCRQKSTLIIAEDTLADELFQTNSALKYHYRISIDKIGERQRV